MTDLWGDMALFIWLVFGEPMIAASAVAASFVVALVIASYYNFLLSRKGSIQ